MNDQALASLAAWIGRSSLTEPGAAAPYKIFSRMEHENSEGS